MDLSERHHDGPIKAVISDLAGTTVDYGSCAPAGAFVELFNRHGVEATTADARGPMGIHKRDHIRAMLETPAISQQWSRVHGRSWTEDDLEAMFQEFIPMQLACLPQYSTVIPGVVEAAEELQRRGIRIGVNTGYNNEMLESVLKKCAEGGFIPDAATCAVNVPKGRPAPWMIFQLMEKLDVYPPTAVVKIGDTIADIEAGLNAGVWTVAVTKTGNLLGLSLDEVEALAADELEQRLAAADMKCREAGAHYVIDAFAELPHIVEEIEDRMRRGDTVGSATR
jgi:phosphonoacetaldehyde hydrolase